MVLLHDDDLFEIVRLGRGTVSGRLITGCIVSFMLAVAGYPPTRHDDGFPP